MATPISQIIPSYPFVQYNDDPDVVAFFTAYNKIAQNYLTAFNKLTLPFWPGECINGYLLDWVAEGIYGYARPYLKISEESVAKGAYNSVDYNTVPYAKLKTYRPGKTQYLPDEYFKRILTWNFYKGDGFQFSITWLKRRIARFIYGKSGLDFTLQHISNISISSSAGTFNISVPEYGDGIGLFLKTAIEQGLVNLPFIYTFNVTVNKQ
ncbi:hypothetical protein N5923_21725 [Erwiniaceae bacterium BAC15a-03b]|uniref:Uncharacterized protein n=1 Tax=Winslowiella arboricola TaxID=2978220 RepID=A0A9J6PUF8_9GAMM|nr:hypothetical protein [Winslowiella arboricola]MCU5774733.1 hypothetical protein [Winslowiella arboricola]MCU5780115.1 hypothetical protein [Winslowiella arboricola]